MAESNTGSRVLVVTGASAGIGAATVRLAAARGYSIAINYLRNEKAAEELAAELRAAGARAVAIQADVSVEADVVRLFAAADRELGRVTHLVNNAATLEGKSRLDAMDAARLQRVFATNIAGSFLCAREAVLRMSTRHGGAGGAIVNVASGASVHGGAGEFLDYAASKGAIDTFTVGLAREVAEEGIRVNAVRPGFIDTAIHAKTGDPARAERATPLIPMKRQGRPEEVAASILWLLSDEASYVTGAILNVTGGR